MKEMFSDTGIEVLVIEPVLRGGSMVSSSRIRAAIRAGDLGEARQMLTAGHAIDLRGIGKRITTGTVRVSRGDIAQVLPPEGEYAVAFDGPSGTRPGQCTIDDDSLTLSVECTGATIRDEHAATPAEDVGLVVFT